MRGYPRSMHQNYRISEYGSRQETQTLSTQPAVSGTRMPTPTRTNVSSSGYEVGTVNAAAVTTTCVTGSTWAHSLIRRNHCLRQHKFPAHYECECEDHQCQDASHRGSLTENVGDGESGWVPTQHPLYFLRTHSRASFCSFSTWDCQDNSQSRICFSFSTSSLDAPTLTSS